MEVTTLTPTWRLTCGLFNRTHVFFRTFSFLFSSGLINFPLYGPKYFIFVLKIWIGCWSKQHGRIDMDRLKNFTPLEWSELFLFSQYLYGIPSDLFVQVFNKYVPFLYHLRLSNSLLTMSIGFLLGILWLESNYSFLTIPSIGKEMSSLLQKKGNRRWRLFCMVWSLRLRNGENADLTGSTWMHC